MDKRQAKFVLQACREAGPASRDPQLAEARAWLERDPELAGWFEAEQAEDSSLALKLREVPVPENLREAILARHAEKLPKTETHPVRRRLVLLALAASVVALVAITMVLLRPARPSVDLAAFRREMQDNVSGFVRLSFTQTNPVQLQQWLSEKRGLSGYEIPAGLRAQPGIGCRSWTWNGRAVGLICFKVENGKTVHLFIVQRVAVPDAPTDASPRFATADGWSSAAWSEGETLFLLVGEGDPEGLTGFL